MSYSKAAAAFTLVAALTLGTYQGITALTLTDELTSASAAEAKQTAALTAGEEQTTVLEATAAELDAVIELRRSVIAEREKFSAALRAVEAALASTDGKVDVATQKERVLAAQAAVTGVLDDGSIVAAQTAELDKISGEITELVAAHDERVAAEQRRQSAGSTPNRSNGGSGNANPGGGGGDWFAEMRSRLDNVGGAGVNLFEYDGNCGGKHVPACAYQGQGIAVNSSIMDLSNSRKNWAMVHELSHIYQFKVWGALMNSSGYQNLFGGNIELLANCMASSRGYTDHGHNSQCGADRLSFASQIWNGIVP